MTNPTLRDKQEGGIQASVPSSPTLEPVTSGAPASLTHPAARSRMDTRTMVSIAMLTGIAYIVMLLSKNMPSVYGFLDDHHQHHRPLGLPDECFGHLLLLLHRLLHL